MYNLVRNFLFLFDAEKVHYFSMGILQKLCNIKFILKWIEHYCTPKLETNSVSFFGLKFRNAIGLGAGFDKNAIYLKELKALGFGFVEIGTVTPLPQDGNSQPRLFRLPKDKGLINRMGFNNHGVDAIKKRLELWKQEHETSDFIIGGNIGKNKLTPNEDAWKDYLICFEKLHSVVDYFVVNVSSPNTPGLRALQEKPMLTKIFTELQSFNKKQIKPKPLLLKIAPDLNENELDDIIDIAFEQQLNGLVISNTTIDRSNLVTSKIEVEAIGAGGLSGKPVQQKSTEVLQYIANKTNGKITLIGSGGIFTKQDAIEKMNAGANLLQVWTGFVYQGPTIVKQLCK
jgi:dihydroorotate dehydrogenase